METGFLGNKRLEVFTMSYGCMGLPHENETATEESRAIALIRNTHEWDDTFFNTAKVYSPFTNKELERKALLPIHNEVKIYTMSGLKMVDPQVPIEEVAGNS